MSKSDNSVERISSLFTILCTLYCTKDRCLERLSVLRKENDSFDVLEELDWEDVETCPGFGCTSPDTIRRIPNQVRIIVIALATKQSWTNLR